MRDTSFFSRKRLKIDIQRLRATKLLEAVAKLTELVANLSLQAIEATQIVTGCSFVMALLDPCCLLMKQRCLYILVIVQKVQGSGTPVCFLGLILHHIDTCFFRWLFLFLPSFSTGTSSTFICFLGLILRHGDAFFLGWRFLFLLSFSTGPSSAAALLPTASITSTTFFFGRPHFLLGTICFFWGRCLPPTKNPSDLSGPCAFFRTRNSLLGASPRH